MSFIEQSQHNCLIYSLIILIIKMANNNCNSRNGLSNFYLLLHKPLLYYLFYSFIKYCRMARGEMVRFIAENNIENPVEIQKFDRLGYSFRSDLSSDSGYEFERKIK